MTQNFEGSFCWTCDLLHQRSTQFASEGLFPSGCCDHIFKLIIAFHYICWVWNRDYGKGSNFWKFYLIRTSFFGESVQTVQIGMDFFGVQECGHNRQMYNILSIGRASLFVMPCSTQLCSQSSHNSTSQACPQVSPFDMEEPIYPLRTFLSYLHV